MKRHLVYLRYVLRHKYYVAIGCRRLELGWWQALIHDMSKFSRQEWGPYARQFYNEDGTKRSVRDASGAYDPNAQAMDFQAAWAHHQKNPHHWQCWISIGDGGSLSPIQMPEKYIREMIADWYGAGRAQESVDVHGWYEKNRDDMILHPITRRRLEALLYSIPNFGEW